MTISSELSPVKLRRAVRPKPPRAAAPATTWTYLAFDGFSPYVDNRPPLVPDQPEERRYRLRYRDNDLPVGDYSDIFVVTAGA